jgi:hypothetical protein
MTCDAETVAGYQRYPRFLSIAQMRLLVTAVQFVDMVSQPLARYRYNRLYWVVGISKER